MDFRLYVVLDRQYLDKNPELLIQEIIEGGCSLLQYRDKTGSKEDFSDLAGRLYRIARRRNIPFIINDRVDIAKGLGVEGVHLGKGDCPVKEARLLLGGEKIIGRSVHNLEEAKEAEKEGADYLGIGPVFSSSTKSDNRPSISRELLKEIAEKTKIPVVAIGGIKADNIEELLNFGIKNFAISADILLAPDPKKQVEIIKEKLKTRERDNEK